MAALEKQGDYLHGASHLEKVLLGDMAMKGKNKIRKGNYRSHRNERGTRYTMPSPTYTTAIQKTNSTKESRNDRKEHFQTRNTFKLGMLSKYKQKQKAK